MRTLVTSVALQDYLTELVEFVHDGKCLFFVDTNVIAWTFRLNLRARREIMQWFYRLVQDERLMIPAWVVHEYNHHLEKQDGDFFHSAKAVSKRLEAALTELEATARLSVDDEIAGELGCESRLAALDRLSA